MSRRPRRNHTPVFKSKVALAAIKGDKTLAELAQQFDVHSNQMTQPRYPRRTKSGGWPAPTPGLFALVHNHLPGARP
jgi:transposase-like protein